MVVLTLTDDQAELLDDILGMWEEGYEDATHQVEQDRTHDDVETYLRAIAGMHEHHAMTAQIRQAIASRRKGGGEDKTTGGLRACS